MKIGVTGVSGHIGNVLCRYFLDSDYRIKALYNKDKRALKDFHIQNGFEIFQGDVLDFYSKSEFTIECNMIINCAAVISIYGDPIGIVYKANTKGPENLIEACIKIT